MSGTSADRGSVSKPTAQEVQANFPDDATLQDALGRLGLAGYGRSDFNLPEDQPGQVSGTPGRGAENSAENTDRQQLRTMGSSMAGTAAAFALAGATIATGGGAGIAVLGAAALGAGATAAASAAGVAAEGAADRIGVVERDQRGADGLLVLAVRTQDGEQTRQVLEIIRAAGATSARSVAQSDEALMTAGVSSASWTGAD